MLRAGEFQSAGSLTDVHPPAVALHQQQHEHVQRNQVDDEHVSSPRRHLQHADRDRQHVSQ